MQDKVNNTHHFRVRNKKDILTIIQIFNGNIITKYKINQFNLWIEAFKVYKMDIKCLEMQHSLNLDNAWLTGFTDAEGCFTSSVFTSQKDDIEFSQNLVDLINGYITHVKSYNGYNTVVNHGKLNKIIIYLHNNPLKTKKAYILS